MAYNNKLYIDQNASYHDEDQNNICLNWVSDCAFEACRPVSIPQEGKSNDNQYKRKVVSTSCVAAGNGFAMCMPVKSI